MCFQLWTAESHALSSLRAQTASSSDTDGPFFFFFFLRESATFLVKTIGIQGVEVWKVGFFFSLSLIFHQLFINVSKFYVLLSSFPTFFPLFCLFCLSLSLFLYISEISKTIIYKIVCLTDRRRTTRMTRKVGLVS